MGKKNNEYRVKKAFYFSIIKAVLFIINGLLYFESLKNRLVNEKFHLISIKSILYNTIFQFTIKKHQFKSNLVFNLYNAWYKIFHKNNYQILSKIRKQNLSFHIQ